MIKLMEWIGAVLAILCLMEMVSNPKKVAEEIGKGPAPNLKAFDRMLNTVP